MNLLSYLDGVNVGSQYTQDKTGYAGPFDINPKTVGTHTTYVIFNGDAQFESCESGIITLIVNPSLLGSQIAMQATPTSGFTPLTIHVAGTAYEIAADGSKKKPAYPLTLELMIFDRASTERLQAANAVVTNPDGTFTMNYRFFKPGSYAIFVNFLGDAKYISAWSNNATTTVITVTGGGVPLSFEKSVTVTAKQTQQFHWTLSATEPAAPDATWIRFADLDLDFGVLGKYWCFIKIA